MAKSAHGLVEKTKVVKNSTVVQQRVKEALLLIYQYGDFDGAHHKQWVIDQVVRTLCVSNVDYAKWVEAHNEGGEYEWDEGIAP